MTDVDKRTEYLLESATKVIESAKASQIREAQNRQKLYTQVTAGTLTFSISFLTLSGIDNLASVSFLIISWGLLILAMICQLGSYIFVDWHFSKYIKDVREWRDRGLNTKELPDEINCYTKATKRFNYTGYALTILGLISMVVFAIINIHNIK